MAAYKDTERNTWYVAFYYRDWQGNNKKKNEIKAADMVRWQNEMMSFRDEDGNGYSKVYLKILQSQLSAIFNHGIRLYELKENPVRKAGYGWREEKRNVGLDEEEYKKFSQAIIDKPQAYYAFEVLFWTGLRVGELLALTPADIDFSAKTISVTKSYQRIKGEDYITDPKTEKSNRTVSIPDFLCEEFQEYLAMLYGFKDDDRMFQITKSFLHHEMI